MVEQYIIQEWTSKLRVDIKIKVMLDGKKLFSIHAPKTDFLWFWTAPTDGRN